MSRLDRVMSVWSSTKCSNSKVKKVKPFFFLGSSECLFTPCEKCVYKPNLFKPVETLGGKDE